MVSLAGYCCCNYEINDNKCTNIQIIVNNYYKYVTNKHNYNNYNNYKPFLGPSAIGLSSGVVVMVSLGGYCCCNNEINDNKYTNM
jgi:hypothetical protein